MCEPCLVKWTSGKTLRGCTCKSLFTKPAEHLLRSRPQPVSPPARPRFLECLPSPSLPCPLRGWPLRSASSDASFRPFHRRPTINLGVKRMKSWATTRARALRASALMTSTEMALYGCSPSLDKMLDKMPQTNVYPVIISTDVPCRFVHAAQELLREALFRYKPHSSRYYGWPCLAVHSSWRTTDSKLGEDWHLIPQSTRFRCERDPEL